MLLFYKGRIGKLNIDHLYLLSLTTFLLLQLALREGLVLAFKCPLTLRPLLDLPAEVVPLSSLCFWLDWAIQLILGSFLMALWEGSAKITSQYLQVPSWAIQQELRTLRAPRARPTLSSALDLRFLLGLSWLIPTEVGFPVTIPLATGLFLPPLLTLTLQTTYPSLALQPSFLALSGLEGLLTLMMTGSCLYSQVLTLKMKFMRSDCFFLQSSSRYLQAPICGKYILQKILIQLIFIRRGKVGRGWQLGIRRDERREQFGLQIKITAVLGVFEGGHGINYFERNLVYYKFVIAMAYEPTSPNVFDAIYISNTKNAQTASQNHSQSTFFFNKRLETIQQFIQLLEDNPENLAGVTEVQLRWERNFFKNELKAALYLNYSLIKLHCQSSQELKQVRSEIQVRTHQQRKGLQEGQSRMNEWNGEIGDNFQEGSHVGTPLKKRLVKEAFQAEKKIVQAKHQLEVEELRKINEHRQCMLKASKEQNEYIRSQLIKMSEKNAVLHRAIKQTEEYKKASEIELKRQKMVIRQLEQNEKKWKQQKRLNQLNCSPIARSGDTFALEEGEISFNHQFFQDNFLEVKQLKNQLEDAQLELDGLRKQLKQRNLDDSEHNQVLNESRRYFLISLEKEYLEVKEQLMERIEEIQKYKKIVKEIQAVTESKMKKLTAENERLIKEISLKLNDDQIEGEAKLEEENKPQDQKCPNCLALKANNLQLVLQIQQIQSKYNFLRQKFDKTLHMQLQQRKQWDAFLTDIKPDINE